MPDQGSQSVGLYSTVPLVGLLDGHDPQDSSIVTVMFDEHSELARDMHTVTTAIQLFKIAVRRPHSFEMGNVLTYNPAILFW